MTVMKKFLGILLLAAFVMAGCTTKSTARANARAAFFEGQARALQAQAAAQTPAPAPGNTVAILGPVKVTVLTWTSDLTLAKTIFAAEYIPAGDPGQIILWRGGQKIPIEPSSLLNGDDVPVQPGDVVELKQ